MGCSAQSFLNSGTQTEVPSFFASYPEADEIESRTNKDSFISIVSDNPLTSLVSLNLIDRCLQPFSDIDQVKRIGARALTYSKNSYIHVSTPDINKTKFENACNELNSYLHLSEDWDGEGGRVPFESSIRSAILLIETLSSNGIMHFKPMLSNDGEVGLYLDDGDNFVDITIEEDGNFSFYAEPSNGDFFGLDSIPISSSLPDSLENLLRKI